MIMTALMSAPQYVKTVLVPEALVMMYSELFALSPDDAEAALRDDTLRSR